MRERVRVAAALVTCLLVLAACGFGPGSEGLPGRPGDTGGPTPRGHVAYQLPFLPVTFSIDTSGNIAVIVNPARLVTLLGTVTVGGGIFKDPAGKQLPAPQIADVTQLAICQKGSTEKPCQAYQIGSGRKIHIEMNGSFVQDIERSRITIAASPGSIIHVTDNGPPTKLESFGPARADVEEFRFSEFGDETDVDLERSRSGTTTDLSYDHISGTLKPIHGAKISMYETYDWSSPSERNDYPSEEECLQRPPEDWRDAFGNDLKAKYGIFCIKTAEGDVGFLFIEPDLDQKPVAYYVYTHTWVR